MASSHLFFLGPPELKRGEKPITLSAAKSVALLAFLAANKTAQSREHILGLLWADSRDEAAHKNLRNALWGIRKALGDDILDADEDLLRLGPSVWVDVREFEETVDASPETATRLYRAPFLEGLTVSDAPEFEIWLDGERERLAQLYLRALTTLLQAKAAQSKWSEVLALAQLALAQDPLQEPMYRASMEAYAHLGDRVKALQQYDILRATLERELGVEPLPETKTLRAAILRGEITPPAPVSSRKVTRGAKRRPPRTPYVGRQAEMAVLDAELENAAKGGARAVLILGEVGIGKSRLWQEWSAHLPSEAVVLETRALESAQSLPLAPLAQLFNSPTFCQGAVYTQASPVSRVWLAEMARLLPELRVTLPDLPAPSPVPPEEERRRLFEAFTQCLLALQGRPLVLFFDDVHWADHATVDWLDYVMHRLRDQPLLLVAAYRPEDAPASLIRSVATWGRESIARKLPLPRLTQGESAALIASLGGASDLADRAYALSAGNPYFLSELLRVASSDIPPVLTDLIRARLGRLPDTANQVLQAAAVLGPESDFGTLRRTSGRNEEEILEALDTLLASSVLTERDGHYEFAHPLVATVVQKGMTRARRAFIHRRAAQALEATHASRLTQVAGQLARHYAEAGDSVCAAHYAQMAAERALALAAAKEAVDWYRQALALEPTPERQMGLGSVLLRLSELEGARAAFRAALQGMELKRDYRGAARAALSMADTLYPSGHFEEARAWIARALTYTETVEDPEAQALAHMYLGSGQWGGALDFAEAEKNLHQAAEDAAQNHLPGIAARCRFLLGNLLAERGELPRALEAFRNAIELAQTAGDDFQEVLGHNNYAYHALLLGDLAAAHDHVDAGLALAEAHALRLPLQHLFSTRGEIALAEKNWSDAEQWFHQALVEAEKNANPREIANDRANLGLAAQGRGDLDGALMLLENARDSAAPLADIHLQIKIDLWLTELFLERGERAAADESLAHAEARLAGSERRELQAWAARLRQRMRDQ